MKTIYTILWLIGLLLAGAETTEKLQILTSGCGLVIFTLANYKLTRRN